MSQSRSSALDLLEPGALLGGALFRSLLLKAESEAQLPAGQRLGPFALLQEIGRGGMGVVYLAERVDGEFNQRVAIKCVRSAESAGALSLFRRERQILAEIRHSHIARLLDGGQLDDGRLWFAMEYVEGARIDVHSRERELSVAARLGLLRQVNAAVAFAHQRLLLHRDIKPGNVLIDSDGGVKLLDFGIAALIGDDDAARAYSPGWASPEQLAASEVGLASDQYQLGLLLDALMRVGNTEPAEDISMQIASGTFLPESAKALPASKSSTRSWRSMPSAKLVELRAIYQRATAVSAVQRYGSVVEFDDELGRWLENRPIAAHSSGIAYTLRCAIRRHVWLTVAILGTVLGVMMLVAGFSWRLAQERDLARAQAERATREAQTSAAVSQFLQDDLLALADPNLSQDVDLTVQTLLERAAGSIDSRLKQQPLIALQIHTTLARSLRGLGAFEASAKQFALAQKLAAVALPADAPQRMELDLWQGDLALANSLPRPAFEQLQRVAELAARRQGANSQLALEAAVRTQAARFELGEQQTAIDALKSLQPRVDAALGTDSPLAIYALNRLAIMYNGIERIQDSERVRAEHLFRASRVYGPEHSTTLTGRLNRAVLLRKLGRTEEALSEAVAAEAGLRKVFGSPSIAALHAMNVRSRILEDSNRVPEAIALQRETLAGRIALLGEWHDDVAYSYVNLGGMLLHAKDYLGAINEYQRALSIRQRLLPADHVDVITNLVVIADAQRQSGQLEAAERNAKEGLARARRSLGPDRPELGSALFRYAQIMQARGRPEAAHALALEALGIYQRTLPATHPRLEELRGLVSNSK